MKRIPFTLLTAALVLIALSACGGSSVEPLDPESMAATTDAMVQATLASDQTAAAVAAAGLPPAEESPPAGETAVADEPPTETPTVTATLTELEMTIGAAGTSQAPTVEAGKTLAAQTQAALPTATPLAFKLLTTVTTEAIVENDVEVTVTAIYPPEKTLDQAWSEIYASPEGLPFSLTTDEEAMEAAIQTALSTAGYGENISDLDVSLNNGLITLSFAVTYGGTGADGRIVFSVYAQGGDAQITMVSLNFGRFTLPQEILDAINVTISRALSGAEDATQAQVTIDEISTSDGEMVVRGVVGVEEP